MPNRAEGRQMAEQGASGSEKLWERLFHAEPPKEAHLAEMLQTAASEVKVVRWWWYGQPAIDLIKGSIDIPAAAAAGAIGGLLKQHNADVQVGLEVFPYGIPVPDWVRVNVQMERNLKR